MRRRHLLAGAAGAVLAACGAKIVEDPGSSATPRATGRAALYADPDKDVWPAIYRAAPALVQDSYRWAVRNKAALQYFPCFCGCVSQGHKSNFECYVDAELGQGAVVLDTHSFG
ncbi:MAG TPA: PCYCGC motif-containing (lipo)protein [Candidatus Limnocylindria bacterium]|nr:PCYCGC motif-containing (lipo)protein [Candidatus Limnocylindria bacterium]